MRKVLVISIAAAAVLVAAWMFSRRPEQVAPLEPSSAARSNEAAAGVSAAGESLPTPSGKAEDLGTIDDERKRTIVRAAFACRQADRFRATAKAMAGPSAANPEAALSPVQRDNLRKAQAECSADVAARTVPVGDFLLDLAQRGNSAAATCYVAGSYREQNGDAPPPDDPRYRQAVPKLIEQGIAAGDWTMASLAASINSTRRAGSPYTHLTSPDPVLALLYTKLMELGSEGQEKADLQTIVTDLGRNLTPADRKSAEARAETLFRTHFARSGPYTHGRQALCRDF